MNVSEVVGRIDEYMTNGGLFNPEMMDHRAVSELLRDCRAALSAAPQPMAVKALVPSERLEVIFGKGEASPSEVHDMAVELILRRRALTAPPAPTAEEDIVAATHRHVKSGGDYTLLGIGKMQSAYWMEQKLNSYFEPVSELIDMREVAIYRGADGQLWARPLEEFNDGRFIALRTERARAGGAT